MTSCKIQFMNNKILIILDYKPFLVRNDSFVNLHANLKSLSQVQIKQYGRFY